MAVRYKACDVQCFIVVCAFACISNWVDQTLGDVAFPQWRGIVHASFVIAAVLSSYGVSIDCLVPTTLAARFTNAKTFAEHRYHHHQHHQQLKTVVHAYLTHDLTNRDCSGTG